MNFYVLITKKGFSYENFYQYLPNLASNKSDQDQNSSLIEKKPAKKVSIANQIGKTETLVKLNLSMPEYFLFLFLKATTKLKRKPKTFTIFTKNAYLSKQARRTLKRARIGWTRKTRFLSSINPTWCKPKIFWWRVEFLLSFNRCAISTLNRWFFFFFFFCERTKLFPILS